MATGLMKLPENRVRRNYTGGAGIDRLHGKARQEDNNMPEELLDEVTIGGVATYMERADNANVNLFI